MHHRDGESSIILFSANSLVTIPHTLLRLPPLNIQNLCPICNRLEWVTPTELERRLIQQQFEFMKDTRNIAHDDIITTHSLLPKYFTWLIEKDQNIGIGMTLCVWNGCTYIYELLQQDGLQLVEERGDGTLNDYYDGSVLASFAYGGIVW